MTSGEGAAGVEPSVVVVDEAGALSSGVAGIVAGAGGGGAGFDCTGAGGGGTGLPIKARTFTYWYITKSRKSGRVIHAFLERKNEITIGSGKDSSQHFDDGDFCAESGIDRTQFETDVASADHEESLWNVF